MVSYITWPRCRLVISSTLNDGENMCNFEEFVRYYHVSNLIACAKRDVQEYLKSGIFWFWLLSTIGFITLLVGSIIKGFACLVFMLSGIPLALAWSIYVLMTPTTTTWRKEVDNYLHNVHNESNWSDFTNYITTQYTLEDSKPLWRSGYTVTWLSLATGQLISFLFGSYNELNLEITLFMVNSAVAVISFLFFIDNILPSRKTMLHLAIKDIKKFQTSIS